MANFILGLTGGIGAGKTVISNALLDKGITIVDADVIARDVVALGTEGLNAISAHFGSDILDEDGKLNRAKLRAIIFSNENEKTWLNQLLHPMIRNEIRQQLKKATSRYVVLSAPLLFENKLDTYCDLSLLIDVPVSVQIQRTCARDSAEREQVESIIASQMSRKDKIQRADKVLDNDRRLQTVLKDLDDLHQYFLHLADSKQ